MDKEAVMYERMLNKKEKPTVEEMTSYCDGNGERFSRLNRWLSETWRTVQQVTFPYGNQYGWPTGLERSSYAMFSLKTMHSQSWSDYRISSLVRSMDMYRHTPRRTLTTNIPAVTEAGSITGSPAKTIMGIYRGYWL